MVGKDKPKFHASSHHVTAITFLLIGIITTGILSIFTLVLNQNHTARILDNGFVETKVRVLLHILIVNPQRYRKRG